MRVSEREGEKERESERERVNNAIITGLRPAFFELVRRNVAAVRRGNDGLRLSHGDGGDAEACGYQYDGAKTDAKIDAAIRRVSPAGDGTEGTWSGREQTMRDLSRIPLPRVPSPLRPRQPVSGDVSPRPAGARCDDGDVHLPSGSDDGGSQSTGERSLGLKSIGGEPLEPNGEPHGPFGVRGVAVRYFGPKQRHSLAVGSHGYTDWITVDAIADSRICVAQLMYLYIRASELLPAAVQSSRLGWRERRRGVWTAVRGGG